MYPQARSINPSIQRVGRLAKPVPFRCRQSPSTGFSSGQATGSQRSSIPNSWASFRLPLALGGGTPVQKEHHVPAPPLGPEMLQVLLKAVLVPLLGLVQADGSGLDIQRPVQDSLIPVAHNGDLQWLTLEGPSGPQGRRLGDDGGISEENHRPLPALQASLQPPFACRPKGSLRASTYLGHFQQ
jgi:hypothetical protein